MNLNGNSSFKDLGEKYMDLLGNYMSTIMTDRLRLDSVQEYVANLSKYAEAIKVQKHYITMINDYHKVYISTSGSNGLTVDELEKSICTAIIPERYLRKQKNSIRSIVQSFIAGYVKNAARICATHAEDIVAKRMTSTSANDQFTKLLQMQAIEFGKRLVNPEISNDSTLTIMTERARRAEARIIELEQELSKALAIIESLKNAKPEPVESVNIFTDL